MKIRELYLKNFGKFSGKKIALKDGINLFYGENESGKSTMHTFIKSVLFGMERGRGRASANDTFSLYEPWEDSNYYAGTLRFESGGKHFLLERTFDKYSKSASLICEDDGEEFSLEHGDLKMILGGLTAASFENTVAVGQMKIETNQSLAVELQNFATNYYSTGNSDINLDGALTLLTKKKKSTEQEMRDVLQEKQQKRYEIEQEAAYVWRDIHKMEEELEEIEKKVDEAKEKHQEQMQVEERRWRVHPWGLVLMALVLVGVFFALNAPWNYLVMVVLALAEGMFIWNRMKDGKGKPQEEVIAEAKGVLEKLVWQQEHLQNDLREKQIQYGNLQEQIGELEELSENYVRLSKKKEALDIAMKKLLELSKDVHQELGAELNRRASHILSEITGGKYRMLLIDEKLKMSLYTGSKKIGIEQVSRGTIEQIYFALRMAVCGLLFEEEYPVILDDTFVFYDDIRLENTLKWLAKNKKQVILFTCQKREGEILAKLDLI